jgi:hypothetical protein
MHYHAVVRRGWQLPIFSPCLPTTERAEQFIAQYDAVHGPMPALPSPTMMVDYKRYVMTADGDDC